MLFDVSSRFYYVIIFITGACSLAYQMIWQKYLNLLLGSEARSSTIIVAVFLLGLALGYYVFGLLAKKVTERKRLLRIYGLVEFITGLFAIIFPTLFMLVFESELSHTNNLLVHIYIALLFLLLPTMLMGATIPCMTSCLSNQEQEVNRSHSIIYGVNTLGAFLGTLLSSFYIIPKYGFNISLYIFGGLNILASIPYIFNNFTGSSSEINSQVSVISPFPKNSLLAMGFFIGLFTITLEMLWFRLLGMTLGNSYIVFPFIVSLFVLGIGVGSLSLKHIDENRFIKALVLALISSLVIFAFAPYLPLFISNIRVTLPNDSYGFTYFHLITYLIFAVLFLPSLFFQGRILPFIYGFLPKDKASYGFDVGLLYFLNTLGCVLGSLFFGYILFNFLDLDTIYRMLLITFNIGILYFLAKSPSKSTTKIIVFTLLIASIAPFPRSNHQHGLYRFRSPQPFHDKNIVSETFAKGEYERALYFADGANTTVAIIPQGNSKFITVNGKSDGSTYFDYTTMSLATVLPYFVHPDTELKASVIGIGTGITAGIATQLKRIKEVDVLEISDAVVQAQEHLKDENFDFLNSPKVSLHKIDAFQFYKSRTNEYDIIVSEPSNPWVSGVENLYTPYFYELITNSLRPYGVFAQWIHLYSMNEKILKMIINNLANAFSHIKAYQTSIGDIVFLASNKSMSQWVKAQSNEEQKVLSSLGFKDPDELVLIERLNEIEINYLQKFRINPTHQVLAPKISYLNYRSFWHGEFYDINQMISPYVSRRLSTGSYRSSFLKELKSKRCEKYDEKNAFCTLVFKFYADLFKPNDSLDRLIAYSVLRKHKYIDQDLSLLNSMEKEAIQTKSLDLLKLVFQEYLKEGEFSAAEKLIGQLRELKLPLKTIINFGNKLDEVRSISNSF